MIHEWWMDLTPRQLREWNEKVAWKQARDAEKKEQCDGINALFRWAVQP